jgi:exopolysaccharide biosynthesis protein
MDKKRNAGSITCAVLLVVMLAALPFSIPSGAITASAQKTYMDNAPLFFEDDEGLFEDEEAPADEEQPADSGAQLSVSSSGGSAAAEPTQLPMDDSTGMQPNPAGYTENGYQDESITVTMESLEVGESMFHVAHVKIADPSQLRTALAGPYGTKKTNKISTMAKNNLAVVAINGDYYTNREGGYITRQGETYRKRPAKSMDMLVIDSHGDFHLLVKSDPEKLTALIKDTENPIMQAFTFGPALVIDGVLQPMPEPYQFNIRRPEPRAAIGQVGPLEYVLVVVDGRSDVSAGVTVEDLAKFMFDQGCIQAFNLDGGNSATLVFHDAFYSHKTENSERSVSDIIYFASAVDPASWQ